MKPIHEEQCQPSTSEKEDNNTNSGSAVSAKQCQANEEKRISKKLPEVKVSSFLLGGHCRTDILFIFLYKLLVNEDVVFLLFLFACLRATKQHQLFNIQIGMIKSRVFLSESAVFSFSPIYSLSWLPSCTCCCFFQ